jgi:hypothetical protein
MSEEQILGQSSLEQMAEVSKRRRTPSQYATQIADFKSVNEPPSRTTPSLPKKTKTNKQPEEQETPLPTARQTSSRRIPCLLPSGKKFSLSLVLQPPKTIKIDRP